MINNSITLSYNASQSAYEQALWHSMKTRNALSVKIVWILLIVMMAISELLFTYGFSLGLLTLAAVYALFGLYHGGITFMAKAGAARMMRQVYAVAPDGRLSVTYERETQELVTSRRRIPVRQIKKAVSMDETVYMIARTGIIQSVVFAFPRFSEDKEQMVALRELMTEINRHHPVQRDQTKRHTTKKRVWRKRLLWTLLIPLFLSFFYYFPLWMMVGIAAFHLPGFFAQSWWQVTLFLTLPLAAAYFIRPALWKQILILIAAVWTYSILRVHFTEYVSFPVYSGEGMPSFTELLGAIARLLFVELWLFAVVVMVAYELFIIVFRFVLKQPVRSILRFRRS